MRDLIPSIEEIQLSLDPENMTLDEFAEVYCGKIDVQYEKERIWPTEPEMKP